MPTKPNDPYTVQYGTTKIEYTVSFKKRKTLAIQVYPDMHVHIVAPLETAHKTIEEKVLKRASWIVTQKDYFYKLLPLPLPHEFASGETHLYLGRRYRLKVRKAKQKSVKLKGQYIWIDTPDKGSSEKVEQQLMEWYRAKALKKFKERIDLAYEQFKASDIPYPTWQIRTMKKRWGSCTSSGQILLNLHLIKAPTNAIDYVIVHELCHLKHPHHNEAFYNLLTYYLPDWDKRRKLLEKIH